MVSVSIDFETRSTVDLRQCGVYPYAVHPHTDVWCMAWAIDDAEPEIWKLGEPFPRALVEVIAAGAALRAWNANFERVIWRDLCVRRYGFPSVELERWHCTMAEALAMGLPRALGHAAEITKISEQKDMAGNALTLRMARPRSHPQGKPPVWWDVPDRLAVLYDYCKQDVRTERAMAKVVHRLNARERAIYLMDQRMNDRGVLVDVPLVRAAARVVRRGLDDANLEIANATGGAVTTVNKVADLTAWLNTTYGIEVDGVRKSVVRELLEGELPDPARIALEARAEAGRSSTAKLRKMLTARREDDRIRGMFIYHGASTGRWSATLVQLQNFPRPTVPDVELYLPHILKGDYDLINVMHPPLEVVSSLLRGMLRASPGHRLMVADYTQIEARVLAWVADQTDYVEMYRRGEKIYERMAGQIYHVDPSEITKGDPRRQIGKNTELGCGYGMGADKFRRTVKEQEGIDMGKDLAELAVETYRATHDKIVQFWSVLNYGAFDAVRRPGEVQHLPHGLKMVVRGAYLYLVLPSGHALAYAAPTIEPRMTPWKEIRDSVMAWGVDSVTRKWTQRPLYGGLLAENVVSALARDLMADAMLRLEAEDFPPVMTVHDEIVCEVRTPTTGVWSLERFLEIMQIVPAWAAGCPVGVEGYEADRYRK